MEVAFDARYGGHMDDPRNPWNPKIRDIIGANSHLLDQLVQDKGVNPEDLTHVGKVRYIFAKIIFQQIFMYPERFFGLVWNQLRDEKKESINNKLNNLKITIINKIDSEFQLLNIETIVSMFQQGKTEQLMKAWETGVLEELNPQETLLVIKISRLVKKLLF